MAVGLEIGLLLYGYAHRLVGTAACFVVVYSRSQESPGGGQVMCIAHSPRDCKLSVCLCWGCLVSAVSRLSAENSVYSRGWFEAGCFI